MAIQNRRGPYNKYNASKMVAGEFAVATDEQKLCIAFAPGLSKRILLEDDMDSPAFTGTPIAPTAASGTNTTQLATTAFVQNAVSGLASTLTATENNGVVTLSIS